MNLEALNGPLDPASLEGKTILDGIQGNILEGHRGKHVGQLFLRFKNDLSKHDEAKKIATLLSDLATGYIKSAAKEHKYLEDHKRAPHQNLPKTWQALIRNPDVFVSLLLTHEGYKQLGLAHVSPPNRLFRSGMQAGSDSISKRDSKSMDEPDDPFKNLTDNPLHGMVIVAIRGHLSRTGSKEKQNLVNEGRRKQWEDATNKVMRRIVFELKSGGLLDVEVGTEGKRLYDDLGKPIEHFGFRDGISQPSFFKRKFRNTNGAKVDPETPLLVVLARDPGAPDAYGSFLAYQKLEQDRKTFDDQLDQLKNRLNDPEKNTRLPQLLSRVKVKGLIEKSVDTSLIGSSTRERLDEDLSELRQIRQDLASHGPDKLKYKDRDEIGALVIGRYKDGRPTVKPNLDPKDPAMKLNDFDFSSDPDGKVCPFHSHIRKMNPRADRFGREHADDSSGSAERYIRIARRGIPYGGEYDQDATKGTAGHEDSKRGLHFMSFQADLSQFLFYEWAANDTHFNKAETGVGAILGTSSSEGKDILKNILEGSSRTDASTALIDASVDLVKAKKAGEDDRPYKTLSDAADKLKECAKSCEEAIVRLIMAGLHTEVGRLAHSATSLGEARDAHLLALTYRREAEMKLRVAESQNAQITNAGRSVTNLELAVDKLKSASANLDMPLGDLGKAREYEFVRQKTDQNWPTKSGQFVRDIFRSCVTLRGGEFFFAPSIAVLKALPHLVDEAPARPERVFS